MSQAKKLAAGVPMADSNGKVTTVQIGSGTGKLAQWYDFPSYSTLAGLGYEIDPKSTKTYFESLLKYLADKLGKSGGCFIGEMTPSSSGFGELHIYLNGKNQDTGLPEYCSGRWGDISGRLYTFGTTKGQFFCFIFYGERR